MMGFFHEREKVERTKDNEKKKKKNYDCSERKEETGLTEEVDLKRSHGKRRSSDTVRSAQNHKELASLAVSPDIPCLVLHVAISFPCRRQWRPAAALFLPFLEARFQAPINHFFLFLRGIVLLRGYSPRPLQ
nr:PREDICTED: uncharacterized protein LOC108952297 [Musa acuminata subsp. malaccensis]